jgi:hypothetical protein
MVFRVSFCHWSLLGLTEFLVLDTECATGNGGCSTLPAVACTNTVGSRSCGMKPSCCESVPFLL